MLRPPKLKAGDKVCIVSPSRTISETQIMEAIDIFEIWGLDVLLADNIYNSYGYLAGTDEQRLGDLQMAIDNPDIKAIFCSRGGYGMSRILDQMKMNALLNQPKWIIGFSDITALHLQLNRIGLESIHGLMPVQFDYMGAERSIKSLKDLIFNDKANYKFDAHINNILGETKAEIIGGNLSLLVDSIGTPSEINTDEKILFIEEIDEFLYKIDRMFNQLKRANKLSKLKGLIIGNFSDLKDTNISFGQSIEEIVLHHTNGISIPIAFHLPIGHEAYNVAIPCGRIMSLKVDKEGVQLYD